MFNEIDVTPTPITPNLSYGNPNPEYVASLLFPINPEYGRALTVYDFVNPINELVQNAHLAYDPNPESWGVEVADSGIDCSPCCVPTAGSTSILIAAALVVGFKRMRR